MTDIDLEALRIVERDQLQALVDALDSEPDRIDQLLQVIAESDRAHVQALVELVEADQRTIDQLLQALTDSERQALNRIDGLLWLTDLSPAQFADLTDTDRTGRA